MDGSAGKVDLQIGVDQGQIMTMSFDSAKTADIGLGARASLTSTSSVQDGEQTAGTSASTKGISAGDLLINGVQVGPSLATSDTLSSTGNSYSAISKAAAINAVSAQTGVIATVSGTVAYGASMDTTAGGAGTITINGYTTSSLTIAAASDASTARGTIVNAINAIAGSTGVKAIDTGDSVHGIQLTAADGRNISILQTGTLTAATTGLKFGTTTTAANVFVGTFQLSSPGNQPIVLSQATPTSATNQSYNIANADLTAGTYSANVAQVVSSSRAAATVAPAAGTGAGLLDGTTMQINGVTIGAANATDDTSSFATTTSLKSASAIATAAAINRSSALTGVTATAQANVIIGKTLTNSTGGTLTLNGVSVVVGAGLSRAQTASAINAVSGQTGVSATDNGQGLTFVAADGRNITLLTSVATQDFGVAASTTATTTYSKVSLSSSKAFTINSGSGGNTNLQALGFNAGTFGGSDNGLKIAAVDVSTASGAQNAITAIDAALKTVSLNQSKAGAYLNRLDSVVSNLSTMNTNITASRSRILDTDYSAETTNLAKSQIISQAATAMLAQANQSAQNVLALLK
jgi:flagellin